jgi:hypothetical protein
MNDKDFDKIFGDRLREERRFQEDENDWSRLVGRLDALIGGDSAAIAGGSNRFRRWLLPLIALLLLLTTGLLFGKLNRMDKTNVALSEQMQAFKQQFKTQHDTIFITKTDTVFIEKNSAEKFNKSTLIHSKMDKLKDVNSSFSELNNAQLIKANLALKSALKKANNAELINANSINKINAPQLISEKENALINRISELENALQVSENQRFAINDALIKLKEKTDKITSEILLNKTEISNKLSDKSDNKSAINSDSFNLIIAEKNALIDQLLNQKILDSTKLITSLNEKKGPLSIEAKNTIKTDKKPTTPRLFVGISGGQISYKTTWLSSQNLEFYRNEKSYQVGLKVEYALTDKLRLTATADYCPFDFKIYWQDSRYNLPTPAHYYPANDKIKSSKALQQLAQASFGAKYLFTDGTKRWRPYVGGAYTTMSILPFEAEFEVQNIVSGVVRTLKESSNSITIANLLGLNGGLEYRFNRRFVAQGEAFYNLDLNRPHKTYDLFGVRGALMFNF